MTIEAQTLFPRPGASNTKCVLLHLRMKALLAEFSIFLRRSVDFISASKRISENTDKKTKRDGNTWPRQVSYKKINLFHTLNSVISTGKKIMDLSKINEL